MLIRWCRLWLVFVLLGAISGCLGPRRSEYLSTREISVQDRSAEADRLWQAAQETLRRHGFQLDRVDHRAGLITTMPEGSQHFFEFWRRDVDTAPDFWEATLNPIRRRAEVVIARGEDGVWTQLAVAVYKQRLSSPDRQFNSTGAAYQYFGDSLPATTGEPRVTAEDDRWLEMGRDSAMEERLVRAIFERVGQANSPKVGG